MVSEKVAGFHVAESSIFMYFLHEGQDCQVVRYMLLCKYLAYRYDVSILPICGTTQWDRRFSI